MSNVIANSDLLYICWLMNQASTDAEGDDGYGLLCTMLASSPFHCLNDRDENRVEEALELRREWAEYETGDICEQDELIEEAGNSLPYGECSMLELLIILSRKIHYEMLEGPYEAEIGKWFRELIDNCGLGFYTNAEIKKAEDAAKEIGDILERIVFRLYDWDGEGGLFPLKHSSVDCRVEELLIQMNNYIAENYDIC